MQAFHNIVGFLSEAAWPWLFAFAFMTALETLLPEGRAQPLAARLPALMFWAAWVPVSVLVHDGYQSLWTHLGIRPLLTLPIDMRWSGALAVVLAPLAGAFVYDFFFYWCHRAQHRFLWCFHAVHHSIEELSVVNAYHHITEPFVQTALILLPMSLILPMTGPAATIMVLLIYLQASLIHSPTRLHLGPLRLLIADNRFHRIHHSVVEKHFDRNFGAFTTVWDRLFGTAWMPAADEWPDTGLAEVRQPRTMRTWLDLPWRYPRGESKPKAPQVAVPEIA